MTTFSHNKIEIQCSRCATVVSFHCDGFSNRECERTELLTAQYGWKRFKRYEGLNDYTRVLCPTCAAIPEAVADAKGETADDHT